MFLNTDGCDKFQTNTVRRDLLFNNLDSINTFTFINLAPFISFADQINNLI